MRVTSSAFILVALSLYAVAALAQSDDAADPLFQSNDILQVTIEGPLSTLIREKSKDDYLKGEFRFAPTDGDEITFDIKFKARGNFRHENCDYPPVRLNFKKSQTKHTLFDKQDKLKLVVHCSRRALYHQIVLQEYLAYRVLNTLTDASMRVRLLQVTYVDTESDLVSDPRYAFLIEDSERTAKRLGLKEHKVARSSVSQMQPEHLNLTSIFEYFIGNTDFSPVAGPPGEDCCHNYNLFRSKDNPIIAIPYDFDQSGFVDAPYANPNPTFRIRSVKQRVYRGRCVNNEHVQGSIEKFREHRDSFFALVAAQEGFVADTREDLVKFMNQFYEWIDDPKDVENKIIERCLG